MFDVGRGMAIKYGGVLPVLRLRNSSMTLCADGNNPIELNMTVFMKGSAADALENT